MMPMGARPAMNAAAPTNDGSTRGSTRAIRQKRRPRRSVRVTSQASAVPMIAADIETRTDNCTVRHSGPGTSFATLARSPPSRMVRQTTKPAGPAKPAPISRPSRRLGVAQLGCPPRAATRRFERPPVGVGSATSSAKSTTGSNRQLSSPDSAMSARVASSPPARSSKAMPPALLTSLLKSIGGTLLAGDSPMASGYSNVSVAKYC